MISMSIRRLTEMLSVRNFVLAAFVALLFVFCVLPFFQLFAKVLFSGAGGSFSLAPFRAVFVSTSTRQAILNTVLVSSLVTAVCMVVAVPLAWILSRTDVPAATRFRTWLCLPFAIPPYVGAIAWVYLANPATGLLNSMFGTGALNIYSLAGLVFVEASFMYTFVLLTALSSLDRMDSSFEEAARLSGASPWRVFWDVSLPLMRPALVGGGLLVFLATAASFGVPALIGGPARIYLVTTQIYTFQKMGTMSGLLNAGALSAVLMVAALLILSATWLVSRRRNLPTVSGKTSRPSVIELGRWRGPILCGLLFFGFIVFVLPISGIGLSSLSRVQGALSFDNFTFANWSRVFFEVDETARAISNSVFLGGAAATIAALMGLMLAYIQTKTRWPGRDWADLIATLPYATPGTVVALALIIAFSGSFLGVFPSLYNTFGLMLVAYVIKYLSFAVKTTADGYRQIDDVLDEAARVSGATWMQSMRTIWLPLLTPALVASWFLVFMPVVSELTMTIFLTGPGLETIGTLIFQLQEYADASGGGASVLAMTVVIVVIVVNFIVRRASRGRYGL